MGGEKSLEGRERNGSNAAHERVLPSYTFYTEG